MKSNNQQYKNQQNKDFKGKRFNNNFNNSKIVKYNYKKCNNEHGPKSCPVYGKKCSNCSKLNHFAIRCKNKKVRAVDFEKSDSSSCDEYLKIYSINKIHNEKNKIKKMDINYKN